MSTPEVGHGRCGRGRGRDPGVAELELPVAVTAYLPLAENMISRLRDAPRRRADHARRPDRRGPATPTPRAGCVLADALDDGGARSSPDVAARHRHPDRTVRGRPRGPKIAGLFGDDRTVRGDRGRGRGHRRAVLARCRSPRSSRRTVRTESKIADLLQHNWVRWGSALVRRGLPRAVRRWAALGPPGHRRSGVQQGAPWGHVPSRRHRLRRVPTHRGVRRAEAQDSGRASAQLNGFGGPLGRFWRRL